MPVVRAATVLAVSIAASAGCASINEEVGLAGGQELSALSESQAATPPGEAPSLTGFDRRGWEVLAVTAPADQVAHHPTYVTNLHRPRQPEAWSPAMPDAIEALDARPDAYLDARHMVRDPFHAAFLALWWPIDMAVLQHWPWNVQAGPAEPYQRAPPPDPQAAAATWQWITMAPPGEGSPAEPGLQGPE